jgi:predicted transcriptional regulator
MERVKSVRRSKLESYQDIICVLAKKALPIDRLAFECNMDCIILQERLDFLATQNLVTVKYSVDDRAFYVLTNRGVAVSKTFTLAKRLEKLQALPQIGVLEPVASCLEQRKTKRVW